MALIDKAIRLGDIVHHDRIGEWIVTTKANSPAPLPHGAYRVTRITKDEFHMTVSNLSNGAMTYIAPTFSPFTRTHQRCAEHDGMMVGDERVFWTGERDLYYSFFGRSYHRYRIATASWRTEERINIWREFHTNHIFQEPVTCRVTDNGIEMLDEHDQALARLGGERIFTIEQRAPFERVCGKECGHLYHLFPWSGFDHHDNPIES